MTRRLLDRLMIFPGEGRAVSHAVLLNFLLGAGLTIGGNSSDALFLKRVGVEFLPHGMFAASLLFFALGTVYAAWSDRSSRSALALRMAWLTAGSLAILWLGMEFASGKTIFFAYYLCFVLASEFLGTHLDLYVSGFFDATQAKRLIPLVGAGQRLGAVAGGFLTGILLPYVGTRNLVLVWVALLMISAFLIRTQMRKEGPSLAIRPRAGRRAGNLANIRDGVRYARRSALLRLTAAGVFVLMILLSAQDYLVSTIFAQHFRDEGDLAAFLGLLSAAINGITLLLQTALTGRLLRRFGLGAVNLVFPLSTLFSFGLLAFSPTLIPAVIGRLNYRGILRSFRHPAYNLHFHGLPGYIQGRSRAMMIGLVLPAGLAFSGLMLMWVPRGHVTDILGWAGLAGACLYLAIKMAKQRAFSASLGALVGSQVFVPGSHAAAQLGRMDARLVSRIAALLETEPDEQAARTYVDLLQQGAPEQAGSILLALSPRHSPSFQIHLLELIGESRPPGWEAYARRCLHDSDPLLQGRALTLLTRSPDAPEWTVVKEWLQHADAAPRKESAVRIALSSGEQPLQRKAAQLLNAMFSSDDRDTLAAALAIAGEIGEIDRLDSVSPLLHHADAAVRASSLRALCRISRKTGRDASPELMESYADPSPLVRAACVKEAEGILERGALLDFLARAASDPEFAVRREVEHYVANFRAVGEWPFGEALEKHRRNFQAEMVILRMIATSSPEQRIPHLRAAIARHGAMAREKKRLALALRLEEPQDKLFPRFLEQVLEEEVSRHLELGLLSLELFQRSETTGVMRTALASPDRTLRALALESLRQGEGHEETRQLLLLMEARHGGNWESLPGMSQPLDRSDVIARCRTLGSDWLVRCVEDLSRA